MRQTPAIRHLRRFCAAHLQRSAITQHRALPLARGCVRSRISFTTHPLAQRASFWPHGLRVRFVHAQSTTVAPSRAVPLTRSKPRLGGRSPTATRGRGRFRRRGGRNARRPCRGHAPVESTRRIRIGAFTTTLRRTRQTTPTVRGDRAPSRAPAPNGDMTAV